MPERFKITFLGTGTSSGVPLVACNCEVCSSCDPRDKRLRSSVMLEHGSDVFVIDAGPDFRQQMLRNQVNNLTAILLTHEHRDHIAGLDEVRAFNLSLGKHIDVYAERRVRKALRKEYKYIFANHWYPGLPKISLQLLRNTPLQIAGLEFIPVRLYHHLLPVLGFRVRGFAYLTDLKSIPDQEKAKLANLDVLVLGALRKEEHIAHLNLQEALELIRELDPKRAYLTHLSHQFGLHEREQELLPHRVSIAYDGLTIDVE